MRQACEGPASPVAVSQRLAPRFAAAWGWSIMNTRARQVAINACSQCSCWGGGDRGRSSAISRRISANSVLRHDNLANLEGGQSPFRVISGHCIALCGCPLYPQKQTCLASKLMSAKCQKRTSFPLIQRVPRQRGGWWVSRQGRRPKGDFAAGHITGPPSLGAAGRKGTDNGASPF